MPKVYKAQSRGGLAVPFSPNWQVLMTDERGETRVCYDCIPREFAEYVADKYNNYEQKQQNKEAINE
jgi:hypothetical protein